ncbi:MAG: hypothetical protein AB7U73_11460 [Pirellulales bacterium]
MRSAGPLDALPLWALFTLTIVGVGIAVEIGYHVGRFRWTRAPEAEAPVVSMVAAMLGLLAFMLAFTFGFAAARYDDRKRTILEEANAIGTTYLRAGMLSEPQRSEVRQLLRKYVDVRLEATRPGELAGALASSTELQQQLWDQATLVAKDDPRSVVNGLFIQSLNQVIDLHSVRLMLGVRSRLPVTIWGALFLVGGSSMLTVGYQEGLSGKRRSPASLGLVVAFSVVLWLIVDLDRPLGGLIQTSQQALIDLQSSIKAPQ